MSRAHVSLLSSLLVAVLVLPAGAQTPTEPAAADSTAPDSAGPKKKGRFGGIMNKAKAVAGNKAVQGAAKGAATNVACNAVPGVAVAAAVSGGGPCQNTLMGGLVQKGVAGTAAAMAGGAASGAAANAAGKLTGVKGAAAAGALNAVTGNTGTSGLAGAAAAMAGAKVNGMSQAAAAAAAAKMMQSGGALPKGANAKAPTAAQMAEAVAAMNAMGGAMGAAATGGKKVETIDFRELKAMLPTSVSGLKRTDATGEKTAAMGMQVSSAQGSYSSDDGKSITLKIGDIGSLSGLAGVAAYAWAANEIDRESDNEYEKTTTFKGFKALEKYNKQSRSGALSVLVGARFIVEAEGSNTSMDALKSALGSVDLRKLEGMKGKGVK